MLIKCPKCRSVYDVPDTLVPDDGRVLRCAECGEIWTASAKDVIKKRKSPAKDIQKMFERVSKETDGLFNEPEIKTVEKIRVVNVTRYKHTINFILLFHSLQKQLSLSK